MNEKCAKEYGICNGEVCEWVLVSERHAPGYYHKEVKPRILKNTEIIALLNKRPQPALESDG